MKKFLVIGGNNATTYKDIFPHIKSREVFVSTITGNLQQVGHFITNTGEEVMKQTLWYTNLDSRHLYMTRELTETYDPARYPKYDNYDAIEVKCVKDIPKDYDGLMGVSKTIALYSPEQFEIVDVVNNPYINGKAIYTRIIVKLVRNEQDKQRQSTQG
jgi:hypothetical protein